jgi:hypothetical protein
VRTGRDVIRILIFLAKSYRLVFKSSSHSGIRNVWI